MNYNDILRRIRYAFDFSDTKMIRLFALADCDVTRSQISDWLKKEGDPEYVEIGDETQIGIRSIIIAHFRKPGKVVIGKKVWIGPNCVISTSEGQTLIIGDEAVIGASSVITSDVPPGIFMCAEHAKPVARVSVPWTETIPYKKSIRGLVPLRKNKEL